ncbi:MAG TPA: di-heme oxidoredictase family protein, partial [Polyangiales bacterium]|nr:di-heme oxidoredictase family protein [Polyangiales bacterium]
MRTSSDIARSLRQLSRFVLIATVTASACADEDGEPERDSLDGVTIVRGDFGDRPLPNLSAEWRSRFDAGDALFDHRYFESQGLGPVYIRASCASCHASDGRGPGAVRKMVMLDEDGLPLSDQSGLTWGSTIRPQTITGLDRGIVAPEVASSVLITVRQPPATFGRG